MSARLRWKWLSAGAGIFGLLILSMYLIGCSPTAEQPPASPAPKETTKAEEPAATPEQPAATPEAPTPTPEAPTPTPEMPESPTPAPEAPTPTPEAPTPTPETPTPEVPESPAPAPETPETPAPTPETPESPAPAPETPEIPAPTPETPETPAPAPETPEMPAPTPETPETPAPAPETPAPTPESPAPAPETPEAPESPAPAPETPESPAPEQPAAPTNADPSSPPKPSSFAPAGDLSNQLVDYVDDLEKAVASEEDYNVEKENLPKEANTLIVIALVLGLHDEDNPYRDKAAAIMKAAEKAAATSDYASAKAAVDEVKATVATRETGDPELKWEKVASLQELMKQVPRINTKLKLYTKGSRFKTKAQDSAGFVAVIAAIAQASMADTEKATNPEETQKWYNFCAQMRDAAAEVNASIHAQDEQAMLAARVKLEQSCHDCHTVFYPEGLDAANTDVP